jgi:hypothetical protein
VVYYYDMSWDPPHFRHLNSFWKALLRQFRFREIHLFRSTRTVARSPALDDRVVLYMRTRSCVVNQLREDYFKKTAG